MVVERQKKVIWINLWRNPKDLLNPLFSSEISFEKGVINVQRSALDEGGESLNVDLQANGRRKILALYEEYIGMTYDLHTSCNGSDMEMTMLYRVAPIKKL